MYKYFIMNWDDIFLYTFYANIYFTKIVKNTYFYIMKIFFINNLFTIVNKLLVDANIFGIFTHIPN